MSLRVLLIDDERHLCDLVKLKFELTWGYKVEVAYSGKEGLEKSRQQAFDLVITDYNMPDMNGEEVLDALKAMQQDLPVFMFSVYHDDHATVNQQVRGKADALISKPIDDEQLQKHIHRFFPEKTIGTG